MEPLKHECGIAMIRLRKPIGYYKEKYGSYAYALNKLYLLMEKQHNRGQEGAGVGVVNLKAAPGHEYVWRERELGPQAIQEIFNRIGKRLSEAGLESMTPEEAETIAPMIGEIYLGHLRYSTTGKSGMSYVHPFLRRNNWRSRNLLMCGNFNMTNVDTLFESVVSRGQHPRLHSDTIILLEMLGYALDKENHRIYRQYRDDYADNFLDKNLEEIIEEKLDIRNVLKATAPEWDGGYVICGATGAGNVFVFRDPNGIRPAYYYIDDEIIIATSERPQIQTVFGVPEENIKELEPGEALLVSIDGNPSVERILPQISNSKCSFERIYFSRGSDSDIYRERKELGRLLVPKVVDAIGGNIAHTVFSYIPNTAEVAFYGLVEGLEEYLNDYKTERILALQGDGQLNRDSIRKVMEAEVRIEKAAIKDIKLRTFIAEGDVRNDLAAHVYDISYGCLQPGRDSLVVIDDSIVRGTTLKQSILSMLARLKPKKIVVVSSSPQVRYPDYYGIDMSRMDELIAFKAAVELLRERGREYVLASTYAACCKEVKKGVTEPLVNHVKNIYAHFSDDQISRKIAQMVKPADMDVEIVYQTVEGLHKASPNHPGDWYFSGNYPTPGGILRVNQAYIDWYEAKSGYKN
ncbi:MAG: amidophosphoribosyltransferase [Muribaculaceae bacterium]|nr:amidophosphoribosyltransferase [Muribaculaceae bacterium]